MPHHCFRPLLLAVVLVGANSALAAPVSFKSDIAPVLLKRCQGCHGPKKAEGGYRVDSYARAMAEGDSEVPGFAGGDLDDSEAFRRIATDDEDERMPAESDPLPAEQIALIRRWIEEGAKFDGDDPQAPLTSIVPPPVHPDPPKAYPHTLPITALAFGPHGKELFAGGYYEITVWSAADGTLLRRIGNQGQRTYALDFSPDGRLLAAAGGAPGQLGELRLFDAASGELVSVAGSATDVVLDARFSPDGKRIAMATADNAIAVFDAESGKRQLLIASHSDWVHAVAWNADGSQLAGASRDKTAKVFSAETGDLVATYSGHEQPVHGVAFHPDGNQAYSSAADGRVQLWRVSDGKKTADVANFGGAAYKLHVADALFVATGADKSARLFDRKERKQIRQFQGHAESVLCAALSPDDKLLATGAFDGEVRVWNAETGEQISSFVAAPGYEPASAETSK